jgi:hypothetical protein
MDLFDVHEAEYYCRSFSRTKGQSTGSLRQYIPLNLAGVTVLREGTVAFNAYRDCSLREVDRLLFLSASQYRRALDLMLPSGSGWAHVTLYYGAFFAASALLAMFGGAVNNKTVIDVQMHAPGHQELRIARNAVPRGGPHKAFWELFYAATPRLQPWLDPALIFALQPVNGIASWQTETRNSINYDSYEAIQLLVQFSGSFQERSFPACLPMPLNTQFQVFDGLMRILVGFARQFRLRTDALNGFAPVGRRSTKIRTAIVQSLPPNLLRRIRRNTITV